MEQGRNALTIYNGSYIGKSGDLEDLERKNKRTPEDIFFSTNPNSNISQLTREKNGGALLKKHSQINNTTEVKYGQNRVRINPVIPKRPLNFKEAIFNEPYAKINHFDGKRTADKFESDPIDEEFEKV